jgi:mannose-6-phosphate isomerase-like protein (cupin superfamily)
MTGKYEKYIVRQMGLADDDLVNEGAVATGEPRPSHIGEAFALMRAEDVPGAKIHMTYSWINPTETGSHWVNEHEHAYDEVLVFLGSDPENPHDLGGEAYLWIDGEKYTITTSGAVYIPAGTRHCPLDWGTITRPLRFNAISLSGDGNYASDENVPTT